MKKFEMFAPLLEDSKQALGRIRLKTRQQQVLALLNMMAKVLATRWAGNKN